MKGCARKTVILNQASAAYSMPGKESFGLCLLDFRGSRLKISSSVHNARHGCGYALCLCFLEDNRAKFAKIGEYSAAGGGFALKAELEAGDLAGLGVAAEEITAVAVACDRDVVMAGFFEGEYALGEVELHGEASKDAKGAFELAAAHQAFKDEIMRFRQNGDINKSRFAREEPCALQDGRRELEQGAEEPSPRVLIDSLFTTNTSVQPFNSQSRDVEWVEISAAEIPLLPINYPAYTSDSFIMANYFIHSHMIFGRYFIGEDPKYIWGLPDRYDKSVKNSVAEKGFRQFKPSEGALENGVFGYWLMML